MSLFRNVGTLAIVPLFIKKDTRKLVIYNLYCKICKICKTFQLSRPHTHAQVATDSFGYG